jgi:hypothetical protein
MVVKLSTSVNGEHVGGKNGSKKILHTDGRNYQLKPSILQEDNFRRKLAAKGLDTGNIAEVLASQIIRKTTEQDPHNPQHIPLAPELQFALISDHTNEHQPGISIISQYYDNEAIPLKQWPNQINQRLLSDIRRTVAIFALFENHDFNDGNLVGIIDKYLRGIDHGHAFGNLTRGPSWLGGAMIHPDRPVLDFFNRETVAGLKPTRLAQGQVGSRSKLWKNFPDETLVLDEDMVSALREIAELFQDGGNHDSALKELRDYYSALKELNTLESPEKSESLIRHFHASLKQLILTISPKTSIDSDLSVEDTINMAGEKIREKVKRNANDMKKTADILDLQVSIEKLLNTQKSVTPTQSMTDIENTMQEIIDKYHTIKKANNFSDNDFLWVKTQAKHGAHQGDLLSYINHRLDIFKQKNENTLIDASLIKIINKKIIEDKIKNNKEKFVTRVKTYLSNQGFFNLFNPISRDKNTLANYLIKILEGEKIIAIDTQSRFKKYSEGRLGEIFSTICQDIFHENYIAESSEKIFYDLIIKPKIRVNVKQSCRPYSTTKPLTTKT